MSFNVQQQRIINHYREMCNIPTIISDDVVVNLIKQDMIKSGKVYPGFESLVEGAVIARNNGENTGVFGFGFNYQEIEQALSNNTEYLTLRPTKEESATLNFLKNILNEAEKTLAEREKEAGGVSAFTNFMFRQIWNSDYSKKNVKKEVKEFEKQLLEIEKASKGEKVYRDFLGNASSVTFKDEFKKLRGVEFDSNKINATMEKSAEVARIKTCYQSIQEVKKLLGYSTSGMYNITHPQEATSAILQAFDVLGVTKGQDKADLIGEIFNELKDHPIMKKYNCNGLTFDKNSNGKYCLYRYIDNKNGFTEAPMDVIQLVVGEIVNRLDKALATGLGIEFDENTSPKELSQLCNETVNKHEEEYQKMFAESFGGKDVKTLSDEFVLKQQQDVATFEAIGNGIGMALMIVPGGVTATSGWLLKGGKFVQTAQKMAKVGAALTKVQQVASPIVMGNMILSPTQLVEQWTSENGFSDEELEEWKTRVVQNTIYMAAGMGASRVAAGCAAKYKTRRLVEVLKSQGKSFDEIQAMIKANPVQFPTEVVEEFSKIAQKGMIGQISAEIAFDVSSTVALNLIMGNGTLSKMEVINSIVFAISGGAFQKQFAPLSTETKIQFLMDNFKEYGITHADAENILKAMDDISMGVNVKGGNVKADAEFTKPIELDEIVVEGNTKIIENRKINTDNFSESQIEQLNLLKTASPEFYDFLVNYKNSNGEYVLTKNLETAGVFAERLLNNNNNKNIQRLIELLKIEDSNGNFKYDFNDLYFVFIGIDNEAMFNLIKNASDEIFNEFKLTGEIPKKYLDFAKDNNLPLETVFHNYDENVLRNEIETFKNSLPEIDTEVNKQIENLMNMASSTDVSFAEKLIALKNAESILKSYSGLIDNSISLTSVNPQKLQDNTSFIKFIEKTNPEFAQKLKNGQVEDSIQRKFYKDYIESTRIDCFIDLCGKSDINPEFKNYLYNEFYLKNLDNVSTEMKQKCIDINEKYGVKIFLSTDIKNSEQFLSIAEKEFKAWEDAGGEKVIYPKTLSTLLAKKEFIDSPGQYCGGYTNLYSTDYLNINISIPERIAESLRHEMMHQNDLNKYINVNIEMDGINNDFLANELRKLGISEEYVKYSFTNTVEFLAVTAQGDLSKCSPKFKEYLKAIGMPDWVFNIKKLDDSKSAQAEDNIIPKSQNDILKAKQKALKEKALQKQSQETETQTLEKGYILDSKTGKPVKVDMSKAIIENTGNCLAMKDEFGNSLGVVTYNLWTLKDGSKILNFEGLHSNAEGLGIGTKLIENLVKVSEELGAEGRLLATASPSPGRANQLTNLGFYYKLGFEAVDKQKHAQIQDCIKNNKPIPLELNHNTEIVFKPKSKSSSILPKFVEGKADIKFTEDDIEPTVENILKFYKEHAEELEQDFRKHGFFDLGREQYRVKSESSLRDKIVNYLEDHPNATHLDIWKEIRDCFACRTIIQEGDFTKHPEVSKILETGDKKAAVLKAAELQSQEAVNTIKKLIDDNVSGDNKVKAARFTNYVSKDGIPYLSENQLAEIKQYAADKGITLDIVVRIDEVDPKYKEIIQEGGKSTTRSQPSGYTALQMNFITESGAVFEWQFRGETVNKFAEAEHLAYDSRTGKTLTAGNEKLKAIYEPIQKLLAKEVMPKDIYQRYNDYLNEYYYHCRLLELGFESTPPKLSDFEIMGYKFDSRLEAESLMKIHDVADALKADRISENDAIRILNNFQNGIDEFVPMSEADFALVLKNMGYDDTTIKQIDLNNKNFQSEINSMLVLKEAIGEDFEKIDPDDLIEMSERTPAISLTHITKHNVELIKNKLEPNLTNYDYKKILHHLYSKDMIKILSEYKGEERLSKNVIDFLNWTDRRYLKELTPERFETYVEIINSVNEEFKVSKNNLYLVDKLIEHPEIKENKIMFDMFANFALQQGKIDKSNNNTKILIMEIDKCVYGLSRYKDLKTTDFTKIVFSLLNNITPENQASAIKLVQTLETKLKGDYESTILISRYLNKNLKINFEDFTKFIETVDFNKLTELVPDFAKYSDTDKINFLDFHYKNGTKEFNAESLTLKGDLTTFLAQNYLGEDLGTLLTIFPKTDRNIGTLPKGWCDEPMRMVEVETNVRNAIDEFRQEAEKHRFKQELCNLAIKEFETQLSSILGKSVEVKRLDAGSFGTGYKISIDGTDPVVLKIYHKRQLASTEGEHGPKAEVQLGPFLNEHSNSFVHFFFGKVPDNFTRDGFVITEFLKEGEQPKYKGNYDSNYLITSEDSWQGHNIIAGQIIDYGAVRITPQNDTKIFKFEDLIDKNE